MVVFASVKKDMKEKTVPKRNAKMVALTMDNVFKEVVFVITGM